MQTPILLLIETKQSVHVTKELLVVVLSIAMVVVMSSTSGGKSEWNHVLRCPGEVESAVKLGQEERDDAVVYGPGNGMRSEKV